MPKGFLENVGGPSPSSDTIIVFPLLAVISHARNEHGMRQQDFARYRKFCSVKVHRLRQLLDKTHTNDSSQSGKKGSRNGKGNKKGISKKAKRKAQSAVVQSQANKGKGNVFQRKAIEVDGLSDDKLLQLLLFEAERAWAYSQELKQIPFDKEQDGSIRRHSLSRLRRAVVWSQTLTEVVQSLGSGRVNVVSRAETASYHALLQGYEAFDKQKHQEALEYLSVARKVFDAISEASNDSRKEALAHSFVDGTEGMMRFSAYNLGFSEQNMDSLANDSAARDVCNKVVKNYDVLDEELRSLAQKAKTVDRVSQLDSVTWRGNQIPIRNVDLVEAISRVVAADADLRLSLDSKGHTQEQQKRDRTHKRQRLTSAQRSAKKRSQTPSVATSQNPSSTRTLPGSRTEMDGYDSLLAALTEAEDVAQRLVQDNAEALSKSHSGRFEASSKSLNDAHEYLLYRLLATRIERNIVLIEEVQQKSSKRQARLIDTVNRRIATFTSQKRGLTVREKGKEPIRRRVKPDSRKIKPAHTGIARNNTSASKVESAKKNKKGSPRMRAREDRLRRQSVYKSEHIAARIVPGIAKLLDANEMSCEGIGALQLVENDPDLTSLIEAKSAFYKAELLRFLTRTFAFIGEHDKALVLLNRADLFIREARNAMELVDQSSVREEDARLLPALTDETLESTTNLISSTRRQYQRYLFLHKHPSNVSYHPSSIKGSQSKALQTIRDIASKYVDFDPVDLEQAVVLDADLEAEFARDVYGESHQDSVPSRAKKVVAPTESVEGKDEVGHTDVEEQNAAGLEGAYDPANALAEEEERVAEEQATASKRGWLGGWFANRK